MIIDEIKKLIKTDSLVIGTNKTLKALRNNEIVKVFLAENAPDDLIRDIEHYASISNFKVEKLSIPNDELGVVCKKPFAITCIGMKKIIEKKKY